MKSNTVLMIGNSFSICVGEFLPEIVRSMGDSIKLTSAYIGGCPLEKHWNNIVAADADPEFKPYKTDIWYIANGRVVHDEPGSANVNRMLKDDVYDIITIQQASHFSWKPESYEPFAGNLIGRIRKDQPRAKIMIQQTWAYNVQDERLLLHKWDFDQTGMYQRLDDAYSKLAKHYGFQRIPTGKAVQLSRERTPEELRYKPHPPEQLALYRWPDLPSRAGDVVGNTGWKRLPDGEATAYEDNIHLNKYGEYLQACVWYGAVYGKDPRKTTYVYECMSDSDAEFLRQCAYDALIAEGYQF